MIENQTYLFWQKKITIKIKTWKKCVIITLKKNKVLIILIVA